MCGWSRAPSSPEQRRFTRQAEIRANFRRLIELDAFRGEARDTGFYPSIATHDDALHRYATERAAANGSPAGDRSSRCCSACATISPLIWRPHGQRVRLYLPFGRDWWPYAVRRIGENPRNAWLLLRSLAGARDMPVASRVR